jgi:hypothetical protein
MIVVSDSTPLIHLAKIGRLDVLFSLYKKVAITSEVYREVVEEGTLLEKEDAELIQNYIDKSIYIKNPESSSEHLIKKYRIHKGEADSIQLAREVGASLVLMNEGEGRDAAKNEGLQVKGTIGIIFEATKRGVIDRRDAVALLEKFIEKPEEYWIEPKIIEEAIRKIEDI